MRPTVSIFSTYKLVEKIDTHQAISLTATGIRTR